MVQVCSLDCLIMLQVCSLAVIMITGVLIDSLDNRSLESQVVHFLLGIFKLVFNFSSSKALSIKGTHLNYA